MESKEFKYLRTKLNKTQNELALLLGTSLKAVRSYEQGWRNIPTHAERQLYLLVSMKMTAEKKQKPCWTIKKCPPQRKKLCPAWEFQAGDLCWFINGTICEGIVHKNWKEKINICKSCDFWDSLIGDYYG
ncbi:helix-turn-helix domain-containing protein [Thermodesulfobacteriota bacterium]